jgi:hypothetical protein
MPLRPISLSLCLALALGSLSVSPPSKATPGGPVEDGLDEAVPARFIMGVKFGGGGALWDEPAQVPKLSDGQSILPIFEETRGGYTMSAGFHLGGLFFEHLGLDVGFHFVKHTLLEQIDWSFTEVIDGQPPTVRLAESDTELIWTSLHMPILVKAVIPAGSTRVTLGVGPEFAFNSWAKSRFEITETDEPLGPNGELLLPGERRVFRTVGTKLEDSLYLNVNFGVEIIAGDFLIPIDFHWSYNFSQEPNYLDRAIIAEDEIPSASNPDPEPTAVTLKTRDTMYGGIRIGLSYQF